MDTRLCPLTEFSFYFAATACSTSVLISTFPHFHLPPPAPPSLPPPTTQPPTPQRRLFLSNRRSLSLKVTALFLPPPMISQPGPHLPPLRDHSSVVIIISFPSAIMATVPRGRWLKDATMSSVMATSSGAMYPTMNLRLALVGTG